MEQVKFYQQVKFHRVPQFLLYNENEISATETAIDLISIL